MVCMCAFTSEGLTLTLHNTDVTIMNSSFRLLFSPRRAPYKFNKTYGEIGWGNGPPGVILGARRLDGTPPTQDRIGLNANNEWLQPSFW